MAPAARCAGLGDAAPTRDRDGGLGRVRTGRAWPPGRAGDVCALESPKLSYTFASQSQERGTGEVALEGKGEEARRRKREERE